MDRNNDDWNKHKRCQTCCPKKRLVGAASSPMPATATMRSRELVTGLLRMFVSCPSSFLCRAWRLGRAGPSSVAILSASCTDDVIVTKTSHC